MSTCARVLQIGRLRFALMQPSRVGFARTVRVAFTNALVRLEHMRWVCEVSVHASRHPNAHLGSAGETFVARSRWIPVELVVRRIAQLPQRTHCHSGRNLNCGLHTGAATYRKRLPTPESKALTSAFLLSLFALSGGWRMTQPRQALIIMILAGGGSYFLATAFGVPNLHIDRPWLVGVGVFMLLGVWFAYSGWFSRR
jgi:hypothetical protein